jgi:AraC-like DNA-binding protein
MPRRRPSPPTPHRGREISFTAVKGASSFFNILCAANLTHLRSWKHAHVFDPFWRVYYDFTSGAYVQHGSDSIRLGPGRFVIVPANVLFETFLKTARIDHFYMHFTIHSTYVFPSARPIVLEADSTGKNLVTDLASSLREKKQDRIFDYQRCIALLHYLFAPVLAEASSQALARPEIAKTLQKLDEDINAFSSISEMAAFAGMSNRNFQRHFHQALAKTPLHYLNEARLREAARRLIHSNENIDEIAFALGFANRFHFSRLFRLFLGTPPAAFRKRRL